MKKILSIQSSINGSNSASRRLSGILIEKLKAKNPDAVVEEIDLATHPLPHLSSGHFTAYFKNDEARSAEEKLLVQPSENAISLIQSADAIVIGVPFYNFHIPDTLKTFLDHCVRAGKTFTYSETGPKGLLEDKPVYLAVASGGVYSDGPMKNYDFAEPYLKTVLGFLGLTSVYTHRAEGLKVEGVRETVWEKAEGILV